MLKDFLQRLYGDIDSGYFYLWTKQGAKSIWFEVKEGWVDEVVTAAHGLFPHFDTYFGISVHTDKTDSDLRGKVENCKRIPGLWAEIDIANDVHAADNLCPDINSAVELVKRLPLAPTYIINSGYGIHVYWKVDDGLPPEEGEWAVAEWQNKLRELAKENNWKIDPTADLARVYRCPDSFNFKNREDPRKVILVENMDFSYKWEIVKKHLSKKPKTAKKKEPKELPVVDLILEKCAWVKHCKEDAASLTEPEWFAMISIINRCQDGTQHIHDWSMGYEGYSKHETDRKIIRAMSSGGPMPCQKIREEYGGESYCDKCKFNEKIPGPIVLGKDKTAEFFARYIYVQEVEKFYDLEDRMFYSPSQLRNNQAHVIKNLDKILLSDEALIKVTSVTYLPNGSQLVWEDNVRKLNSWRPHDVQPIPGDISVFMDHFKKLLPDDMVRKHFLNFLAYNVQYPGQTTTWTPLIIGEPGAGKSWILRLMQRILGHNCQRISLDTMFGRFTEWQQDVSLLFIEEVKITHDRQTHTERLNDMITMETCLIDIKSMRTFRIPKRFNFIMFSNHEDAIPLGMNDRRFMVYRSPLAPLSVEDSEKIHKELDNSAAFHDYLMKLDLTDFKPNASAPLTDMKQEMMIASEAPWQTVLRTGMETYDGPFAIPVVRCDKLADYVKEKTGRPISPAKIAIFLKKLGHQNLGPKRIQGSIQIKVWSIRDHDTIKQIPESALRKMFEDMRYEDVTQTDEAVTNVMQMKPTGLA